MKSPWKFIVLCFWVFCLSSALQAEQKKSIPHYTRPRPTEKPVPPKEKKQFQPLDFNIFNEDIPHWWDLFDLKSLPPATEKKKANFSFPLRIFYLEYIFQPDNIPDEKELKRVQLNEVRFGFLPKLYVTSNLLFGAGIEYSGYDLGFDFVDRRENSTLHSLSMPLDVMYLKKRVFVWSRLNLTLGGDLKRITSRTFLVAGGVMVGFRLFSKFWIGGGAYLSDDFGRTFVVPIGGFYWKPNDKFILHIIAPKRALISWEVFHKFFLFAYYDLDSAQGALHFRQGGGNQEEELQFNFMKVGGGISLAITRGLYFNLTGGTNFRSRFEFRRFNGQAQRFTAHHTAYLMVSFTMSSTFFQ